MLKKFSVTNFKGFETEMIFDLTSANGYAFNPNCVKNGIVNSCMVYGHNGCGKSNLCLAVFDIINHLTDKHCDFIRYQNYLNAKSNVPVSTFIYEFLFDGILVRYTYRKLDFKTIAFESLEIDENEVVRFDRSNGNTFKSYLVGSETLNPTIIDPGLSALKYIKNNSVLEENEVNKAFFNFFSFVENMLFFRSLEDRTYIGQENTLNSSITAEIIKKGMVKEFEAFLNEAHVNCKLAVVNNINGQKDLAFDFDGKLLLFTSVMSTGTSSLMLFFYWYMLIQEKRVSMVIIDEFDAFYHHELSRFIIRKLMSAGVQFVVTTHNTTLMSNELMRPDCYFLIGNNKMLPLSLCTDKELREVHNIEKIYKSGGFYVG